MHRTRLTRPATLCAALLALTACAPPIPDSGAPRGAGFDSPAEVNARREAALQRATPTPSQTILPPPTRPTVQWEPVAPTNDQVVTGPLAPAPGPADSTEAADIAAQTRAVLGQTESVGAPAPLPSQATAVGDLDRDNPNISREQDFEVVSQQRGIEADAERLRIARQQYQLVTPVELQRPNDNGPNIIAYALNQAQPRGASGTFPRNPLATTRRAETRCLNYRTNDVAQEEFLAAGGPERDRLGLDPDGDGNACAWDPEVYVNLVRGQ